MGGAAGGPAGAVAARQRRRNQGPHLVAGVRPARRIAQVQVLLYQLEKAEVRGEGGREEQAGIGHQAVVVKDDANTVGVVCGSIY